jgi:hypothetical protein
LRKSKRKGGGQLCKKGTNSLLPGREGEL